MRRALQPDPKVFEVALPQYDRLVLKSRSDGGCSKPDKIPREAQMGRLMIRCPATGREISSGIEADHSAAKAAR
jgi:hypothetical protein